MDASTNACDKTMINQERDHLKRIEGIIFRAYMGPRRVPVFKSDCEHHNS